MIIDETLDAVLDGPLHDEQPEDAWQAYAYERDEEGNEIGGLGRVLSDRERHEEGEGAFAALMALFTGGPRYQRAFA